jgi:hypothetical protein
VYQFDTFTPLKQDPMRSFLRIPIAILAFLSLNLYGVAQAEYEGPYKKRVKDADFLFEDNNQLRALAIYDSLWKISPGDNYLQYWTGVTTTYKRTAREQAYEILVELEDIPEYPDVTFWLARAKHLNYNFQEGIDLYNKYLETDKPTGTQRILTLQYIENCRNGIQLMARQLALSLEILTPPSNLENSQYSPVISADGKQLYYTNRGPDSKGVLMDNTTKKTDLGSFYEDVYVADRISEERFDFSEGRSLSDNINKAGRHEAPLSISYDNKTLFVYISSNKRSEDIYYSTRINDTTWSKPKQLKGINTPYWEGHACLAPDGKTLYFSSDRPGGLGGRDIYQATMKSDSTFGNVTNLGPKINTDFNEDGPFIHSNGSSLYFSSEAHASMGGYDMFHVKYDSTEQEWQEVVNLGYPINTTDDDRFYYITGDGEWGFFSSARASGENLHDIYRIKPGTFERLNTLVLLIGTVYIDEIPSTALAKIMDDETGDVLATLVADSITGEFVYSLLPGRKYKISLLADGFPPKVEYVDVPPIKQGVLRFEHRFDFYTKTFLALQREKGSLDLQNDMDGQLNINEEIDSDGLTFSQLNQLNIDPEQDFLTDEQLAAGYRFRVQVGAYRNPGKFTYGFLRTLGNVQILSCDDGITRYLMGQIFMTRPEAEVLRQKCIEVGEWDAWITVRR